MERLLKDAQEISGVKYYISNLNDVYEAIHVIQEELGITGTTALEAGETISGSLSAVKASWENLVTGLATGNSNIDELISNVVEQVTTFAGNAFPTFEKAISGIGKLVEKMGVVIAKKLPSIAGEILPALLQSATNLVNSIIAVLPSFVQVVTEQIIPLMIENLLLSAPQLIEAAVSIIATLANGLGQQLPTLVPMAIQVIITLVNTLLSPENIRMLTDAALQLIMGLADGLIVALPILINALPEIVENLVSSLISLSSKLTAASIELIAKLAGGLIFAIPDLIKAIPQIIAALVMGIIDGAGAMFDAGADLIKSLFNGMSHDNNPVLTKFKEWFDEIGDFWEDAWQWGADLVDNFVDGITSHWKTGIDEIKGIAGDIADYIGFSEPDKGPLSDFHTFAPDMMNLFMKGIEDNEDALRRQIASTFDIQSDIAQAAYTTPQSASMGIPIGFGNMQTGKEQPIVIQIDGETFAKFVYKHYNNQAEKVGTTLTEAVSV